MIQSINGQRGSGLPTIEYLSCTYFAQHVKYFGYGIFSAPDRWLFLLEFRTARVNWSN